MKTFTLNGKSCSTDKVVLSYADIARLSGHASPSVTYRVGATGQAGVLMAGDAVAISTSLVVNAYNTGSA